MKTKMIILSCWLCCLPLISQTRLNVRGLCVQAPQKEDVDKFVKLVNDRLAPAGLNTLVLRVDFNYNYQTHPELREKNPLTKDDVKKMVDVCKLHNIQLIPQVNLLGHQSWAGKIGKLLEVYPQFDETPTIEIPVDYKWPNADGLYCKSYCPQHPEVHAIVFDLVDEITDAFESDAFHAGMDEVFYIAHDDCERCKGGDPAVIYAAEVTKINNHLAQTNKRLWIWGDRLIDGKATGIGLWEGSYNNTHRAIDLIPKSVVINDWHYEKAHPTPVLFAAKGFDVIACPWNRPNVALQQFEMINFLKENASDEMNNRYLGIMHTYWGPFKMFLNAIINSSDSLKDGSVETFNRLAEVW